MFHWRFDSKIFKRLILIWFDMLLWWLHLNDLKINLLYLIFNIISCLFIYDFFKIIKLLFKLMINKKTINSKYNFIVNLKSMTWIIDKTWRSSNFVRIFNFNNNINFIFNMLHINCVIFIFIKINSITSILIKTFNLCCWLLKINVQLIIKNLLTKKSNIISWWIKKIVKHLSITFLPCLNSIFKFICIIWKLYYWRFCIFSYWNKIFTCDLIHRKWNICSWKLTYQ